MKWRERFPEHIQEAIKRNKKWWTKESAKAAPAYFEYGEHLQVVWMMTHMLDEIEKWVYSNNKHSSDMVNGIQSMIEQKEPWDPDNPPEYDPDAWDEMRN